MAKISLLRGKGGPAMRPGSSLPASHLLRMGGRTVVVHAGLGVSAGVIAKGVELVEIEAILVMHLHSDQSLELGPLLHTAWAGGLRRPVRVIGPSGLARYFKGFWAAMKEDVALRIADEGRPDIREMVELRLPEEGTLPVLDGFSVTAMRNEHPPIDDSYASRLEAEGKAVVLLGDTAFVERMVPFARGADLLTHEAMLTAGIDALCARVGNADDRLWAHLLRSHCPAARTGVIAREADIGILALNHLVPGDDPSFTDADWCAEVATEWDGDVRVGRDGMTIEL